MPPGCWDIAGLADDINNGRAPADAGVRRAVSSINALNGSLNALVDFDAEASADQVIDLQRRVEKGERPPLAGVPVAVKDHFHVKGWRCTQGSLLYRDVTASADDPVVARLKAAGAIIVGRSNMSEFGCKGVTTNRLYGTTLHPRDPDLTPGGSSGGAASAVAAGMVPLGLASDGGGSVRRPAAHTGTVGFKPSTGLVADPRACGHTSVSGVIAETVPDTVAMVEAIAGYDPADPVSVDIAAAPLPPVDSLNIAWSARLGLDVPVDDDVAEALGHAIERLRRAGLAIGDGDPDWPPGAGEDALMPLQHAELAAAFGEHWRRRPDVFDPDIGAQIESGLALSGVDIARASDMGLRVARAAAAFFAAGIDLLLAPSTPCVAWPHTRLGPETIGGRTAGPRGHAVFTPLINHAFCPAISIPAGHGRDRLPVGLQVIGRRFSDRLVLSAAQHLAAILGNAK